MNLKEIISLLNNDVENVCRYLLPNGKRVGHEWRVGSLNGEPGKSLGIHLNGNKAGVWADFATGEKGDLFDLWKKINNATTIEAINQIKRYFNINEDHNLKNKKIKNYQIPPKVEPYFNEKLRNYLIQDRKLTIEMLEKYIVMFTKKEIVFPYYKNKKIVNRKYLWYDTKGKKQLRTESNAEPCLFGWHTIDDDVRDIVICEGEIDAISMAQYGFPALSVPYGAGVGNKNEWIENDYDLLDRFDTIYICMDMDEPGQTGAKDIINRLGRHRCKLVELPYNDVNECLQRGVTKVEMAKIISNAKYLKPDYLRDISDYDLVEEIRPKNPIQYYSPQFHTKFSNVRLYPAELTILGGINGSGKTTFLMQMALDMVAQKNKVVIASFEQKPEKYLKKIIKQATLESMPSADKIKKIVEWLSGKIMVYDIVGVPDKKDMLETFEYAYRRFGINHFIIDSLTKMGFAEDDYNGQKLFTEELTNFVKKLGIHIILVVHSRKLHSEKQKMDKMDLKGTGAISDLASNVMILVRNKAKEEAIDEGRHDLDNKADATLIIRKQREYGWEGALRFNYDRNSETYYEQDKVPIQYYIEQDGLSF